MDPARREPPSTGEHGASRARDPLAQPHDPQPHDPQLRGALRRDPSGARKLAFAAFVRRGLELARTTRAWNGSEVARRTGISRQTINRWIRGDWASDPEPDRVVAFCTGIGLDAGAAFRALGWDPSAQSVPRETPLDPDVAALLRRLADPTVPDTEKFYIRETVRYLAYRPTLRPPADRSTGRRNRPSMPKPTEGTAG